MINRNSHIPLYIQLSDLIRKQIEQGMIRPGDKLLSESEMIQQYQLGRLTIREALALLANEGLIEKHHGKGTYCKSSSVQKKQLKIDVLLDMADDYFVQYYLQSICGVLETKNVNVIVNDTKNKTENICTIVKKILLNGSDGVLIKPCMKIEPANEEFAVLTAELIKRGIPYIMIDNKYDHVPPSYVIVNEEKVGALAADYFLHCNHSALCMICCSNYKDSVSRMEGFMQQLSCKPYIIEYDNRLEKNLKDMLCNHPEITGIFCYNDLVARDCMNILSALNISIPERISIISVDDTVIATTVKPSLTSISHPKGALGTEAAQAILSIISGESAWPYQKTFEPELIERKSCKCL